MKKTFITSFILFTLFSTANAETIWYPLPKNAYSLKNQYPEVQKLLFAFDYGHALVYEKLLHHKDEALANPENFEADLLKDILQILKNPPETKTDEGDIAPLYVQSFSLAVGIFDWSHLLHQFVYDELVSRQDGSLDYIKSVQSLFDTYNKNQALKITDQCKSMLFMDGHFFSKAFRRTFPSFNLLIWSYHWLQIKLYEDLLFPTKIKRDQAVAETVTEFKRLVSGLPDSAEFDMMPETETTAPKFTALFPKIAATFDTNHMLHDVISDILTSEKINSNDLLKSQAIAVARFTQDPEAFKRNNCPKGEL